MLSYSAYVLVGEDCTGKSSFQRYLAEILCSLHYQRLPTGQEYTITHAGILPHASDIFIAGRSYQEIKAKAPSVDKFFKSYFVDSDIVILSTHSHGCYVEAAAMIAELHSRAYNVSGVFFSNEFGSESAKIATLNWDERLWIHNEEQDEEIKIQKQIRDQAAKFVNFLEKRVRTS